MYKLYRDTFFALKFQAEVFRGIGYGTDVRINNDGTYCPVCAYGMLDSRHVANSKVLFVKNDLSITIARTDNDQKVISVLQKKPRKNGRISFNDWCAAFNIDSTDYIDEDIPGELYFNQETCKWYMSPQW